jgi:3alpha(or 20beta)-hydroxysteroid dehydrogenase
MNTLEGKVIAITGGAGGIGEATARMACAQGASVVITDLEAGPVEAIAKSLGERAVGLAVDVSRREDNERMVATAVERFGRLDAVFLNAGIEGEVGPFDSRPMGPGRRCSRSMSMVCVSGWRRPCRRCARPAAAASW